MKKLLVVAAALAVLQGGAAAEIHRCVAGAGETIKIGFGATNQDPVAGAGEGSRTSAYYDLQQGGVLEYDATGGSSTIWNQIIATNGLAIIDLTDHATTSPILYGGIYTAGGKGWIRVKGKKSITIGSSSDMSIDETGPTDVLHVEFVDANDAPVAGEVIYNSVYLGGVVTNCPWSRPSDFAYAISLFGDKPVLTNDVYSTYSKRVFTIGNDGATRASQLFRVEKEGTLRLRSLELADTPNMRDDCRMCPFYVQGKSSHVLDVPASVELLDSTSRMHVSNLKEAVRFRGDVTGSGYVDIDASEALIVHGTVAVPVRLASHATLKVENGAMVSGEVVATGDGVGLRVGEGSATISSVRGTFVVQGVRKDLSTVSIGTLQPGTQLTIKNTVTVLFNGSATPPNGAIVGTLSDGSTIMRMGDGVTPADISDLEPLATPYEAYEMGDGAVVANVPAGVNLRAGTGTSATVKLPDGDGDCTLSLAGGAFAIQRTGGWQDEVSYWFDASRTNTDRLVGEGYWSGASPGNCFEPGKPYIEQVVDWRGDNGPFKFLNPRLTSQGSISYVPSVYPYLCVDEETGLHYLDMGERNASNARRIAITTADKAETNLTATLVVMAFNSAEGGGWALVGSASGAFARSSTAQTAGILSTGNHDVWVDGVKLADPTATGTLNGKWQVVTIDTTGEAVNGFGWIKAYNDKNSHGGQRYGEILIFTNAVSELTRCEAEAYLAKKWGVKTFSSAALLAAARDAAPDGNAVTASGSGTVELQDARPIALGGNFKGTVQLAGGVLTVKNLPLPYTEETLPQANLLGWYDPDCRETVKLYRDLNPGATTEEIRYIVNRAKPAVETDDKIMLGVGSRMPSAVPLALGYGLSRTWMDYDGTTTDVNGGNTMRFVAYNSGTDYAGIGTSPPATSFSVGTGFIVVDSRRTAFTAFQSDVQGTGGDFRRRTDAAIWGPGSSSNVTGGETRLNGCVVSDQSKGFSKCPELLSFRPTANAYGAFFGNFNDTEKKITSGVSLLMGESIFYSSKLSDEDTARIEGYLMTKWLGLMPPTCVDPRGATVSGFGTVKVDEFAKLPKIDPGFEGLVSAAPNEATGSFTVTIDPETDEVTGALVAPQATVALPAACTLTVKFTSEPASGKRAAWTVFDGAELSSAVEWTLQVEGAAGVKFVRDGNRIQLKTTNGLMLLVR